MNVEIRSDDIEKFNQAFSDFTRILKPEFQKLNKAFERLYKIVKPMIEVMDEIRSIREDTNMDNDNTTDIGDTTKGPVVMLTGTLFDRKEIECPNCNGWGIIQHGSIGVMSISDDDSDDLPTIKQYQGPATSLCRSCSGNKVIIESVPVLEISQPGLFVEFEYDYFRNGLVGDVMNSYGEILLKGIAKGVNQASAISFLEDEIIRQWRDGTLDPGIKFNLRPL